MDRLERIKLIEELEAFALFHQEKTNYYLSWLQIEKLNLSTIGFVLNDNTATNYNMKEVVLADNTTIKEEY